MDLLVGTNVRFDELYRPFQVRRGTIGTVVDMEERTTPSGTASWVRARFGDFHHALDRGVAIGAGELTPPDELSADASCGTSMNHIFVSVHLWT